jgi:hypothetical protein
MARTACSSSAAECRWKWAVLRRAAPELLSQAKQYWHAAVAGLLCPQLTAPTCARVIFAFIILTSSRMVGVVCIQHT